MPKTTEVEKETERVTRPPIVVVMGHIDHGKTSLLDYIRKSAVAEKESGGITQHIGAYQTEHHGRRITFIDTPGHEAFSAMRIRGTHVADIAVLVVAADEGVKPQTEEAIQIIREAELPFVVAINKVDKPNSDPVRVKNQLAEKSILVEGFGGTVPVVELSAKTGEGVPALLETILLLAELEELESDPLKPGEGVVVESHLDPQRGATATLLVGDGTVRRGGYITVGKDVAPVRIFENFQGEAIEEAHAAEPIRIIGFPKAPALGEPFRMFNTRGEAEAWVQEVETPARQKERTAAAAPGKHIVHIVLKTDVLGSEEALVAALEKIGSDELGNRVVKSEVGDINESDIKLAAATKNTFVVGFRVKFPPALKELSERSGVTVVTGNIIYELLDSVRSMVLALAPAELRRVDMGTAKILALFKEDRAKQIVGGRVETGKIAKGARFDLVRNSLVIGAGKILELQSQHKAADEVPAGQEFGILADTEVFIAPGDTLTIFTEEKVALQL